MNSRQRQKVVVVEANEVPPRIFEEFARRYPKSTVARLLSKGRFGCTVANDVPEDALYPSQTWASFNTGLPYSAHAIHWYNDPKPRFSEFFWHHAARNGYSTVLVNTLHSSPLGQYLAEGNYRLVVPDCFATDSDTVPQTFRNFQNFNRAATKSSGRKTDLQLILKEALAAFLAHPKPGQWGLDGWSVQDIVRCAVGGILGRPERARNAQFPLLASIFCNALKAHDPDLAVLFTNHVAANQHRYWYALYPEDYRDRAYGDGWVAKYKFEILGAMRLLDRWLGAIVKICEATDRMLLISTSMGQAADQNVGSTVARGRTYDYRVADPAKLAERLFPRNLKCEFEAAMVPQYTFVFQTSEAAAAAAEYTKDLVANREGLYCAIDVAGTKVTVSVTILSANGALVLGSQSLRHGDLGFVRLEVDDHHSGRHHPLGSLVIFNDKAGRFRRWHDSQIGYLEYAPELKEFFTKH